ncbi:MAG: DNA polymerase III subunit beta [Bacillota bacterium]|jgi:DNA polymerase-3 subunit beta
MKFSCPKEKLLNGIQTVQRAVSSRTTVTLLTGIYLETSGNNLIFRGTDLEIFIEYILPAEILAEGKTVLPARFLHDLVRRLPDGDLRIEQPPGEQSLVFHYGKSQVRINGMDPTDFPHLPAINQPQKLQISAPSFHDLVGKVNTASSTDITRPVFSGIYVETEEDGFLTMVATDTHRLAYAKTPLPTREKINFSFIAPTRSLMEISRLTEEKEILNIVAGTNQASFQTDGLTITTRLIEGDFPMYRQVIPEAYSTRIRVNTSLLYDTLDRAVLLAREDIRSRSHAVYLKTAGNTLVIQSQSPEIGTIYEEIPIYLEGEDMEIAFNGKYLTDALKSMETEEVYFDLTGALSPGIFRPVNNDDFLYLILPVRRGT